MEVKGKLTSLLSQHFPEPKKIIEYGRSKKLDVDELVTIAVKYSSMVAELGPELNPLHIACIRNRPDVVSALIQEGYNVNDEVGKIDSYLRIALDYGNVPVAHLLLDLGADPHVKNSDGKTPMEAALSKNKREKTCTSAVRLLVDAGVSLNADCIHESQEKPLHLAISNSLPSVVSYLLQRGADGNITDLNGCTPLHYACYKNEVEIIKLLVKHKVKLYETNVIKDTPLIIVVRCFYKEALNALISGGCDINKVMVNGTCTALNYAIDECSLSKIKYLIGLGADPNKRLSNGLTPLHVLASRVRSQNVDIEKRKARESLNILEFLVKKGANISAPDNMYCSPLQIAILNKYFVLAKHFIRLGANLNAELAKCTTIFHLICSTNHDIIILALEHGADYNKKSRANMSPYHSAIVHKVNIKFIKSFIQFGCPYNQDFPVWKKIKLRGTTELRQFITAEEQFFKGINENNVHLVKQAVRDGAVPTGCSEEFKYPLHFLAYNGHVELLKYLLENAFPANAVNDTGETALFVAAKQGHYDVCRTLLQFGACYNYRNRNCSKTPKMVAAEFGHKRIVSLFDSVVRMFRLASVPSNRLTKALIKVLSTSCDEYYMYVNCTNNKHETLMSTTLSFKYSEKAKELMQLRNFADLNKLMKLPV